MSRTIPSSLRGICALAMLVTGTPAMAATVIYNNFGSGMSFASGGYFVAPSAYIASSFTPATTATLSSVDIALSYYGIGTNGAVVHLVNDASGSPGSTILESWTLSGLPSTTSFTPESLTSVLSPTLVGGTQYWLVALASGTAVDQWRLDGTGATGYSQSATGGAPWFALGSTSPAFDVKGLSAVPLPAAAWLLLSGLSGLGVFARRKRIA